VGAGGIRTNDRGQPGSEPGVARAGGGAQLTVAGRDDEGEVLVLDRSILPPTPYLVEVYMDFAYNLA
jgi:hypothetical protein